VVLASLATIVTLAPTASADVAIGSPGSGAGQYGVASSSGQLPDQVAVDRSNGNVYLFDTENFRIDVFTASGSFIRAFGWGVADGSTKALQVCTATCFRGIKGSGAGQFAGHEAGQTAIAVDSDPASPAYHNVYVYDGGNNRVQEFEPSGSFLRAFGWGVADGTTEALQVCTATCFAGLQGFGAGQFDEAGSIAVGPGGIVYVFDGRKTKFKNGGDYYDKRVQELSPSGSLLGQITIETDAQGTPSGIAVDSIGDFYLAGNSTTGAVRKYDPSGALLNTVNPSSNISAIGVDAADNLYVGDLQDGLGGNQRAIFEYDPAGAKLRVFYGDAARRLSSLAPYSGAGGDVFAVSQEPAAVVHIPFPVPGPVVAPGATKAIEIGNTRATLTAQVNPENKASTYHFQYVDQTHFESGGFSNPATVSTVESPPASADFNLHEASLKATGLVPKTVYHFRLVATNADGTSQGAEATFETLAPLAVTDTWATEVGIDAATLHASVNPYGVAATGYFQYVDDASYEASGFAEATDVPNVGGGQSPLGLGSGETVVALSAQAFPLMPGTTYRYRFVGSDVFGTVFGPERTLATFRSPSEGEVECPNQAFRTGAGAALPDCRAYEMVSPLDKGNGDIISPAGFTGFRIGFFQASRAGGGITYSSYRAFPGAEGAPYDSQYLSRRGEDGWTTQPISPPQGIARNASTTTDNQFLGATPDLSSGWFLSISDPPLTPDAPEGFHDLYRRDLVGGGFEALNTVTPPHPKREFNEHAFEPELEGIAGDGSSVFVAADNLTADARPNAIVQLYDRSPGGELRLASILPDGTASKANSTAGTFELEKQGGIEDLRRGPFTHALSEDGSKLYFSSAGKLYLRTNPSQSQSAITAGACTEAAKACTVLVGEGRFQTAAADGSRAIFTEGSSPNLSLYEYDAGSKAVTQIAGSFEGLVGTSEDARRVYFASRANLATGATAGKPNVYLHEAGGATAFVVTLEFADAEIFKPEPFFRFSRVSADGLHLAFASTARLTGYDNTDVNSGAPDEEVYVYEAGGEVLCASCNPGEARPAGSHEKFRARYNHDIAAFIPGWQTALYAPRALSDDGSRLFFSSYDALSPRDTNGAEDVYEWEAPGAGTCTEESPSFSRQNGGCVSLISSGESPSGSEFLDASPDGGEVFFTTGASLLPQDDGLVDVYVAKVDGGYSQPPAPPAGCEGEACQSPPEAPNDPTPASASFEGAGNVVEEAPAPAKPRCAKGKVRRKGHCVAKGRHRRAAHKRRAAR
jgi:hypothetical protein